VLLHQDRGQILLYKRLKKRLRSDLLLINIGPDTIFHKRLKNGPRSDLLLIDIKLGTIFYERLKQRPSSDFVVDAHDYAIHRGLPSILSFISLRLVHMLFEVDTVGSIT